MSLLRLFAGAREAAGTDRVSISAATVGELLEVARSRFGAEFAAVLSNSRVWVNGEPALESVRLEDQDEVAVIPPVSGG